SSPTCAGSRRSWVKRRQDSPAVGPNSSGRLPRTSEKRGHFENRPRRHQVSPPGIRDHTCFSGSCTPCSTGNAQPGRSQTTPQKYRPLKERPYLKSHSESAKKAQKQKRRAKCPPHFQYLPSFQLESVACRTRLHVPPRINRRVVHSNFIVHVRACRAPADAGVSHDFAALHASANHSRKRRKVRVPRGDAKPMIDHHQPPIARMILRDGDHAIRCRMHGRAVIGSHIHTSVKRTLPAERIKALAKAIRDVSHDRPNRRCVGRIC